MAFIARLEQALAGYSDWSGEWVHYSDVNKIGVNPQQFHQDIAGVYLFPKEFKTWGTIWKQKKYKFTVRLSESARVLDLSKLSQSDLRALLDKLEIRFDEKSHRLDVDSFWEALVNHYVLRSVKNAGKWNADFRRLGYDAIFDDTGSIHSAEVQVVVLNPKILKVVSVETQSIKRGQFDRLKKISEYLLSLLKPFGKTEFSLKKKKELYSKESKLVGRIELYLEDDRSISWRISEDEGQQKIFVSMTHANNIPALRDNWGSCKDFVDIEYDQLSEVKKLVDRVMSKANAGSK